MAGEEAGGRLSRGYAVLVTRLRWLVLAAVAGAVAAASMLLPAMGGVSDGPLDLVPADSPPARAQLAVLERFGLPLLSRVSLVQHAPGGFGLDDLANAYRQAAAVDVRTAQSGIPAGGIAGALPVPNSVDPARPPTTIVTYLFGSPEQNVFQRVRAAQDYADRLGPDAGVVGIAGPVAVQVEQGAVVGRWLDRVEAASLAAVALIVGLAFRSVVAPVVTLVSAGVAYVIADHIIGEAAALFGTAAPSQLQPVVVALTLGATTDYSVFFLSGMRARVLRGADARDGLRFGVAHNLRIVLVAGITVAAGVATLLLAQLGLFRAFGPGLAITILVSLTVSVTLVPALLAVAGRWALWPAVRHIEPEAGADPDELPRSRTRDGLARLLSHRGVAAVAIVLSVAALLAAAAPLRGFRASVASEATLPTGNPVRTAAEVAGAGFAPGVLSPTEVVVQAPGITADRAGLTALQRLLSAQPRVAAVVGPVQQPVPPPDWPAGLFLAPKGDAARYLVVFDDDALSAAGIADLRRIEATMPGLLDQAGLSGTQVAFAGDSALGDYLASTARTDLIRVGIAIGLVNLALLVLFLRAAVAPIYLLASSFLSVIAALGITTWVFQDVVGYPGLIFYAPFAAAVLLISLGSDYNIFTVGQIWGAARELPLRRALVVALPRSSRPVNVAGLTLAASFALVALIPIAPLRELACAMAVGVLIDTFLVRTLLVPSLIVLVGAVSGWPGRRLAERRAEYVR